MKFKGLYLLLPQILDKIYGPSERKDIEKYVDIYAPVYSRNSIKQNFQVLRDAEVIFSSWGCPTLDVEFFDNAPNLKAIFYAAGSVRPFITDEVQKRGVVLTTSLHANAVPVAEFCLSQIIFCLKLGWHFATQVKRDKYWPKHRPWKDERLTSPGCYGSTVGIISLGAISSKLIELLHNLDVNILVHSSRLNDHDAKKLGVKAASLEETFKKSDVISIHSPGRKEGQITGELIASMKKNASLINTSRGKVIKQQEMIEVLKQRTDLFAVLDVTDPEPPEPGSEIFDMPNIITVPHISGSKDYECRRLGRCMVEEFMRFANGQPLKWQMDFNEAKSRA